VNQLASAISRRGLLAGAVAACAAPGALVGEGEGSEFDPECVFCQIVAATREATFVWQDDRCVAFGSIGPLQPGHLLLVPRRHYVNLYELPDEVASHLLPVASRLARALKTTLHADGLNLWQSNEKAAGQSVFHFHLHLIPRFAGREIFKTVVEVPRATPQELEAVLAPVRATLASKGFR
jgi:histidine triad (HIT) family protein